MGFDRFPEAGQGFENDKSRTLYEELLASPSFIEREFVQTDKDIISEAAASIEIPEIREGNELAWISVINEMCASASDPVERNAIRVAAQQCLASSLEAGSVFGSVALFVSIAELNQSILHPDLTVALQKQSMKKAAAMHHEMIHLANIKEEWAYSLLHQIFKGIESYFTGAGNFFYGDPRQTIIDEYCTDFFYPLVHTLRELVKNTNNLLVRAHAENCLNIPQQVRVDVEEGGITGVPGGNRDEVMYALRKDNLLMSDRITRAIGVSDTDGIVLTDTTLPLNAERYGKYHRGNLVSTYEIGAEAFEQADAREKEYLRQNNPDDESIYARLEQTIAYLIEEAPDHRQSIHLEILTTLHQFQKKLRENGRHFYFDLTKISSLNLHPFVFASIINHNRDYIRTQEGVRFVEDIPLNNSVMFLGDMPDPETLLVQRQTASLGARKRLEDDLGVSMTAFSQRTQTALARMAHNATIENWDSFAAFVNEFGESGCASFLSLEQEHPNFGTEIVEYAQQYKEAARAIFASYGALLREADELESFTKNELDCNSIDCITIGQNARRRLLQEMHTLLKSAITDRNPDIVRELDEHAAHQRALSSAFTSYFAAGGTSLEAMNSFRPTVTAGPEVSPVIAKKIIEIYRKNYQTYHYDAEAIDTLVAQLEAKLSDPNSHIHLWKFGEENILAFAVATESSESQHVHISGLNINPDLRTSKAAVQLLEEMLAKYSEKEFLVTGESSPKNFMGYSTMQWVATNAELDELGVEDYMLNIAVYPNHSFASKEIPQRDLAKRVQDTNESVGDDGIIVYKTNDPKATPSQLGNGYVATRSFRQRGYDGSPDAYIFVLEPAPTHAATVPQTQIAA